MLALLCIIKGIVLFLNILSYVIFTQADYIMQRIDSASLLCKASFMILYFTLEFKWL